MKIVCSWCRHEGKSEFIGEKAPFDDSRETHGICPAHRDEVRACWLTALSFNPRSGITGRLSSVLLQWMGLLGMKKTRP
jgi:hypothetical protein